MKLKELPTFETNCAPSVGWAYAATNMFCLLSKEHKQISNLATCRAYVCDAINAYHHEDNHNGAMYVYSKEDFDNDNLRICMILLKDFSERIELIVDFMHKLEEDFGFKKTEVFFNDIKDNACAFMLVADKKWMTNLALVSLYLLLLRSVGPYHEMGNTWQKTLNMVTNYEVQKIIPTVEKFAEFGPMMFFKECVEFNYKNIPAKFGVHLFGIEYHTEHRKKKDIEKITDSLYGYDMFHVRAILKYSHRFKTKEQIRLAVEKRQANAKKKRKACKRFAKPEIQTFEDKLAAAMKTAEYS